MWNSICCSESEISERIGRNHVRGDSCSGYPCSPVNLNWMALRPGTSQLEWIVPFMWLGPCDSGFGVLSQKLLFFFFVVVVYLFSTTFDPANTVGNIFIPNFIPLDSTDIFLLLMKSCVTPTYYMTLKRIVFLLKIFQFMAIFSFYY